MIIYGINPIMEALRSDSPPLERIWITRGKTNPRLQDVLELARTRAVPVRFESSEILDKKASGNRHQDVVAEIASIRYLQLDEILSTKPTLLLAVDGVEDPHNLGAVLRTAEAAGVEGVLIPHRRASPVTPTVVKASAGAAMHLRIAHIGNVVQTLRELKEQGFWVVGLHMEGESSVDAIDMSLPLVFVIGGEHRGVRRLVREHCDFLVALPMKGRVSSLNLSVAAGILLYRILLKRDQKASKTEPRP